MWEISISDSAITRPSLLHAQKLKRKPAIINHQQDLELPYNNQAACLLLDAIKPTTTSLSKLEQESQWLGRAPAYQSAASTLVNQNLPY